MIIPWLAAGGIILSLYTFYIEKKIKNNEKTVCDVSERISCSKSLKSRYAKLFSIPNGINGVLFFSTILVISFFSSLWTAIVATLGLIPIAFLAYISYVKERNFCLVCTGVYLITIIIVLFSYLNL